MNSKEMAPITVNKVGGKNMVRLNEIGDLVKHLDGKGESMIFVVSAFTGVTNALIKAMDQLNGTDYKEYDINKAFEKVTEIHGGILLEFFDEKTAENGKTVYWEEFEKLKKSLMAHKENSNILMPEEGSYAIRDQVYGFGEKLGGSFLELYLKQRGFQAQLIDDVRCKEGSFEEGAVSNTKLHQVMQQSFQEKLKLHDDIKKSRENVIRILGGHVANTPRGIAVDVGRSYSDTTAVNVAIAVQQLRQNLAATRFWKDEKGVLTANPQFLSEEQKSKTIKHDDVSFEEALEMAAAGSNLMQIDALDLAATHNIDLEIRNVKTPHEPGTRFTRTHIETDGPFKTIVEDQHIDTVTIELPQMANRKGFCAEITRILASHDISIEGPFSGGTNITFGISVPADKSDRKAFRNECISPALQELKSVTVDGETFQSKQERWTKDRSASVSIIGNELAHTTGILYRIASVISSYGVNIRCVTQSEFEKRITFIIDNPHDELTTVVRKLHAVLVENDAEVKAEFRKLRERLDEKLSGGFHKQT